MNEIGWKLSIATTWFSLRIRRNRRPHWRRSTVKYQTRLFSLNGGALRKALATAVTCLLGIVRKTGKRRGKKRTGRASQVHRRVLCHIGYQRRTEPLLYCFRLSDHCEFDIPGHQCRKTTGKCFHCNRYVFKLDFRVCLCSHYTESIYRIWSLLALGARAHRPSSLVVVGFGFGVPPTEWCLSNSKVVPTCPLLPIPLLSLYRVRVPLIAIALVYLTFLWAMMKYRTHRFFRRRRRRRPSLIPSSDETNRPSVYRTLAMPIQAPIETETSAHMQNVDTYLIATDFRVATIPFVPHSQLYNTHIWTYLKKGRSHHL